MNRALVLACIALAATACARTPAPPALAEYRDQGYGFVIQHPSGWHRASRGDGATLWVVPPALAEHPEEAAEFIAVFTEPLGGLPDDAEIRRVVFGLLPVHGVSGFRQDTRTTLDTLWYKFEVTGTSDGMEWASVGVVAAGSMRLHVAVCAKPLDRWRDGQKQCDEVIRSFQPGRLSE